MQVRSIKGSELADQSQMTGAQISRALTRAMNGIYAMSGEMDLRRDRDSGRKLDRALSLLNAVALRWCDGKDMERLHWTNYTGSERCPDGLRNIQEIPEQPDSPGGERAEWFENLGRLEDPRD